MNAAEFFGAMFDPFKRITDFSGRSTRPQFWPFIFLYYAGSQLVTLAMISPFMSRVNAIVEAQAQSQAEPDPDAFAKLFTDGSFTEMMKTAVGLSVILSLLFLVPLAGAVTRRLHDTNRSGLWALPSVLLLLSGLFLMWRVIAPFLFHGIPDRNFINPQEIFQAIIPIFINNLLYIITIITLLVFCAQDGTIGPNRFGEDPKGRGPAVEAVRSARPASVRLAPQTSETPPPNTPKAPARVIK
jgi:uncharacterized membrane protein YhaH (DUF805 family)